MIDCFSNNQHHIMMWMRGRGRVRVICCNFCIYYSLVINNLVRHNLTNIGSIYLEKTTIVIVKIIKEKIT